MSTIIKLKRSETAASVPAAGVLDTGEVALNTVDKKIYVKDSGGIVKEIANAIDTLPGLTDVTDGTNGQFLTRVGAGDYQFADIQTLDTLTVTTNPAGSPALSFDGTSVLTYTPPLFEGLSDVDTSTSTSTLEQMMFSNGNGTYSFQDNTIANHLDVEITGTPNVSDILAWNPFARAGQGAWAVAANPASLISVSVAAAGTPNLTYNTGTKVFTYTPPTLAGVSDTNITTPSDGQILTYNATLSQWENTDGAFLEDITVTTNAAGAPSLVYDGTNTFTYTPPNFAGLDDTNITTPASGQYLEWDGTDWVNVANPLSTITVNTAAAGVASLVYDGADTFTYTPPTLADLPDTTFASLSTGNFMRYDGSVWRNVMINQLSDMTVTTNAPGSPALSFLGTTLTYTPPDFGGLSDVDVTNAAFSPNMVMLSNGDATYTFTPYTLSSHTDVNYGGPLQSGDYLVYTGSNWTRTQISQLSDLTVTTNAPGTPALSFSGTTLTYTPPNFAGLDDTNITSAAINDHLYWDGTDWVNTPMPANVVADGEVLQYTAGGSWTAEDIYDVATSNRITREVVGSDIVYSFL